MSGQLLVPTRGVTLTHCLVVPSEETLLRGVWSRILNVTVSAAHMRTLSTEVIPTWTHRDGHIGSTCITNPLVFVPMSL